MNSKRLLLRGTAAGAGLGPLRLLTAQMLFVIVLGACLGCWRVQIAADTSSYVNTSQMKWREALTSTRTLGYPLLLKLVRAISPGYGAIPWIHLGALCAGIFILDASVRRFGVPPWDACAVSSATLYATLPMRTPVAFVLTDFLAMIVAVVAVACLLCLVADRRRAGVWISLTVAVAAAYHIRPAYMFLIPLIPCLGVLLLHVRARETDRPRAWLGFFVALLTICLVPWIAYCGLRLVAVGKFGLVNFAGYNLSGLAAEMLDADMVQNQLPVTYRPLAQEIMAERSRLGMKSVFRGRYVDMALYERQFSPNIYKIAVPVAKRLYGDDPLTCDDMLARFSRSVISLRMGEYLLWVAYYIPRAVTKIVFFQWIIWLLAPLAAVLTVARWIAQKRARSRDALPASDTVLSLKLAFWVASTYFAAYLLVICLSGTYADSRLVVPAGVFVPALILLCCVRESWKLHRIGLHRCANFAISASSAP